jgi:SAM-dependent methyltransferase
MNSSELSKLYKIRFTEDKLPRKNAIWQIICESFLQRFIKKSDTVIDVACGYGEFLNNILAEKKIAVDLNADARKFLDSDTEFHQCSATHFGSVVSGRADVVFTSNFLEHLPDKTTLNMFLDQVMTALKPGGKYIILGPNLRYLPGQYWDFYDHHLGLTHLSLSEALELKGFDIQICIDRFLPFTTQGALPTHPWLVWIYLKLPVAWKYFGKQFFIVAQKPIFPANITENNV